MRSRFASRNFATLVETLLKLRRHYTTDQIKDNAVESMGYIFGMMGMTFGLMGFIFGINATTATTTASARIANLEKRLDDAGIADVEGDGE